MPNIQDKIKRIEKLSNLEKKGSIGILEYLYELEDRMDTDIPALKEIMEQVKGKQGEDYVISKKDYKDIAKEVDGKEIAKRAIKNIDLVAIANAASKLVRTPQDGKTPTKKELTAVITPLIRKIGKDSLYTDLYKEIAEEVITLIPNSEEILSTITGSNEAVRDGLELLEGDERLDVSAIKGIDELTGKLREEYKRYGASGSIQRTLIQLLDTPNSYSGQAGKTLVVNSNENGLDFGTSTSGSIISVDGSEVTDPDFVDSPEIDFSATGSSVSASLIAGSIDETKLDTSVNDSLDLADSALQFITAGGSQVTNPFLLASPEINIGAAGNFITFTFLDESIAEGKLKPSVQTSLGLADSALQSVDETADYDWTGQHTFTDLRLPNSTAPSVTTNGDVAIDTSVTDLSHGVMKFYSGEELFNLALPVSQLSALIDNYVPTYNATTDEFEMQPVPSGSGDTITTYINNVKKDSSGGTSDAYGSLGGSVDGSNTLFTVSTSEYVSGTLSVFRNGKRLIQGSSEDWVETTPGSGTFTFATAPESGDIIDVEYTDQETTSSNILFEKTTITISSNTTGTSAERNVLANASSSDVTYTLPAPSDIDSIGIRIKKIDNGGNLVTLAPNGAETIDGDSTYSLSTPDEDICVVTDGTNYYLISN